MRGSLLVGRFQSSSLESKEIGFTILGVGFKACIVVALPTTIDKDPSMQLNGSESNPQEGLGNLG